jgi:predicted adenine nucleotide alpha hydrolase (AANH) superfamily ATPase
VKLLLHACCAPCAIIPVDDLQKDHQLTLYWYNPNIHPAAEYLLRREALDAFLAIKRCALIDEGSYDIDAYFRETTPAGAQRCRACYRLRLEACARVAMREKFDAFATTMTYSPYQDHAAIREIGQELENTYGVKYMYRDWREQYREGKRQCLELGLYRQKYCGCIYSEQERYQKKLDKYESLKH